VVAQPTHQRHIEGTATLRKAQRSKVVEDRSQLAQSCATLPMVADERTQPLNDDVRLASEPKGFHQPLQRGARQANPFQLDTHAFWPNFIQLVQYGQGSYATPGGHLRGLHQRRKYATVVDLRDDADEA